MENFLSDEEWEVLPEQQGLNDSTKEVEIDERVLLEASYFIFPTTPKSQHQKLEDEMGSLDSSIKMLSEKNPDVDFAVEVKEIPVVDASIIIIKEGEKKDTQFVDMTTAAAEKTEQEDLCSESNEEMGKMNEEKSEEDDQLIGEGKGLFGINWGWKMRGIEALCSLGMAAATICIIVFGRQMRQQQQKGEQNQQQKLTFHICAEDSRIKEVVRHANRFNQALLAMRGVPVNGAQITFGGYYDGM